MLLGYQELTAACVGQQCPLVWLRLGQPGSVGLSRDAPSAGVACGVVELTLGPGPRAPLLRPWEHLCPGLEAWRSRGCPREAHARGALGWLGDAGGKCTASSPPVGVPRLPTQKTGGSATPACLAATHSQSLSVALCVQLGCAREATWASAVRARFPSVSPMGPGGPGPMSSAPECWLAVRGQGPPGGSAHWGPNQSLACGPKRKTLWKGPMVSVGF